MWDFLNEAWGGFQSAYEWWNQEGPGAGESSPPPSGGIQFYGQNPYQGGTSGAGISGIFIAGILAAVAVLIVIIVKK